MADSPKLKRLKEMRDRLAAGKFSDKELKESRVADTDGRMVRLADDDAAEVIARRIAVEEGQ